MGHARFPERGVLQLTCRTSARRSPTALQRAGKLPPGTRHSARQEGHRRARGSRDTTVTRTTGCECRRWLQRGCAMLQTPLNDISKIWTNLDSAERPVESRWQLGYPRAGFTEKKNIALVSASTGATRCEASAAVRRRSLLVPGHEMWCNRFTKSRWCFLKSRQQRGESHVTVRMGRVLGYDGSFTRSNAPQIPHRSGERKLRTAAVPVDDQVGIGSLGTNLVDRGSQQRARVQEACAAKPVQRSRSCWQRIGTLPAGVTVQADVPSGDQSLERSERRSTNRWIRRSARFEGSQI